MTVTIRPVEDAADRKSFVDLAYDLNRDDPNWVPPLKTEVHGLIDPRTNPWFEHAEARFFLAERDGRPAGRISAQVDQLVLRHMGAGTGQWGMFEAADAEVASELIHRAEAWLRGRDMTRSMGPFSLSIWDEPGLLVKGHDHPPMVMMGHNKPEYEAWVESAGYAVAKRLLTYDLPVADGFPPLIQRIVASGEKNERIRIRNVDKRHFDRDAAIIIDILNEAWSNNWGFVPFTESEKAYGAKKLAPLIIEGVNMIAELDGEPVAFMMSLPDVNALLKPMKGRLFPFNWIKLLWWLRNPQSEGFRVPLMGVVQKLQASRLASQLAFMMIEHIRRYGVAKHGARRAEVGWILEDNQGMV